jgi:hypothetical protein
MEPLSPAIFEQTKAVLRSEDLDISTPMLGQSHSIYVVTSPNGQKWSLRIAKDEFAASLAARSTAIMKKLVRIRPTLQIPTVIHVAESYSVLQYLDGVPIKSWNTEEMDNLRRHRILDGLAFFLHELWTCPADAVAPGKMHRPSRTKFG